MVARVQKTAEGYVIPVTPEMAERLKLVDGSEVDLQPVAAAAGVQYAVYEAAMDAFERTLPLHENSYRALAK